MRSFKKIAAMALAVAMLCSFTAFAGVDLDNVAGSTSTGTVEINYGSTASQTSLLVFKGTALTNAEDVIYINQYSTTVDRPTVDLPGYGDYTVMVGGTDVATAASKKVTYALATYSVTVNSNSAEGYYTHNYEGSLSSISGGEDIEFFFGPKLGYKVASVSVNGNAQSVAPAGGSIAIEDIDEDIVIDVTWAEISAAEGAAFTSAEIYDIPKDLDAVEEKDQAESKLVFGKVINRVGQTPIEVGMYMQRKVDGNWGPAYTSKNVGPYFAAEDGKVIDSKYGIRFFSFEAGEYKVQSYAKYGEGDYDYGSEIVFTVN